MHWYEPLPARGRGRLGGHGGTDHGRGQMGVRWIVKHLGSVHDAAESAALLEAGRQKIAAEQSQGLLDLESLKAGAGTHAWPAPRGGVQRSTLLWHVLHGACTRLDLGTPPGVMGFLSRWSPLV